MAIDHKFSSTAAKSVKDIFQSTVWYKVPKFQRNYSWDSEKIDALWNDLMENFMIVQNSPNNDRDAQYLLGPMVVVRGHGNEEYIVIDGQQRLSTLTMLFCVARDILQDDAIQTGNTDHIAGLDKITEMIENTHMDEHRGWKLTLNDTDQDLFREIQTYEKNELAQIDRINKLKTKIKSKKFLRDNYKNLYYKISNALYTNFDGTDQNVSEEIKNMNEDDKRNLRIKNASMLNYFLTHVRDNNFVVQIVVSDDNTAFQIFETLNDRFQKLSKSNLIKNHVLNQVKTDDAQTILSDQWNNIFDVIVPKQDDDDFIMESLRSRDFPKQTSKKPYKPSNKNLYKIIKSKTQNDSDCKRYIKGLEEDAEFVSQLNDPSLYADKETKDEFYAINTLGAKLIRIPIITAHRKWGISNDYRKLVEFLVKFFFKYRVVRQKHPGAVEKIMIDVAQMIDEGKSLKDIFDTLKKEDDHDDFVYRFKRDFAIKISKNIAKFVLYELTNHLAIPNNDVRPTDDLTLEHILPQTFTTWNDKDFFEDYGGADEQMSDFVPRLGNLTLLHGVINPSLQNHPFDVKLESGYNDSNLEINKQTVCTEKKWTAKTITDREEKFAEYADKIWNLDTYYH